MKQLVKITEIRNTGDNRGFGYVAGTESLGFLHSLKDMHVMSIVPGASRGNHYHGDHREILLIVYTDTWLLRWDSGANTNIEECVFSGSGSVLLEIEPMASHLLHNQGSSDLLVIGLSDIPYNGARPDSHNRWGAVSA